MTKTKLNFRGHVYLGACSALIIGFTILIIVYNLEVISEKGVMFILVMFCLYIPVFTKPWSKYFEKEVV